MSAKSDFEKAQQRIATAKAEGARTLNLSGLRDLIELPDEIRALTALTSLDLWGTQVTDLTPLTGLTALISLDLGSTKVTDLTPLKELTALTWLDLNDSSVLDLSPLRRLHKLTTGEGVSKVGANYFGGLTFTGCVATHADLRIAEIAGINDPAEGAKALFAYLDNVPTEKPAGISDPDAIPPAAPAPKVRRPVFLPAVSKITSTQLIEVLKSSYPDLRLRTAHLLSLVEQEMALFALLPIPNETAQLEDHRAKGVFLETMTSGLLSLADDLPEIVPPATTENARQLKQRLKALAQTVDASIAYLDKHDGAYGGLWKIGLVSSVAGLLTLIPGVSFLPATILPGAVFGVQTVKLVVSRGKDQKD